MRNKKSLWVKHGYHTASVILKRKKLAVGFEWCSDSDSWLERVIVAHREGWELKKILSTVSEASRLKEKPKLVDAIVWRFRVTREFDASLGGMIMSPVEYVRCSCANGGVNTPVSNKCNCMWCSKVRACGMVHAAELRVDRKFGKGVKLPRSLGRASCFDELYGRSVAKYAIEGIFTDEAKSGAYVTSHIGDGKVAKETAPEFPVAEVTKKKVENEPIVKKWYNTYHYVSTQSTTLTPTAFPDAWFLPLNQPPSSSTKK